MATQRTERERFDDVVTVLGPDGRADPALDPHLTADDARRLQEAMLRARVLDDRLTMLQRQGRIAFHIGGTGEEATIVGAAFGLRATDWIFPCYREIASALLRGTPLSLYLNNMFGNAEDPARGRQMPDHFTDRPRRWGSVSSPVGTQIVQAAGFAWAAKLSGDDAVTLVFFGDGATSEGDFHVGLNFAGVFRVPCLFVCRNNGWAISVPRKRQTASETFAEKAVAYGIPGVRVDGNDLLAVIAVTRQAAERARQGGGSTLIEALTYRVGPHSTSDDPRVYRDDAEVAPWRERDPILRFRKYLEAQGLWTDEEERRVVGAIEQEIRDGAAAAEKIAPPPLESMFEDVYKEMPWHLREQLEQAQRARKERS